MGEHLSRNQAADDAESVSDLPSLIRERIDRGASLEALATASGGAIGGTRWSTLSRGEKFNQFPDVKTLRGVARALNLTEATVVLSAAQYLGMDMGSRRPTLGDRIPSDADKLPRAVQAAIVNLVVSLIDEMVDD